MWQQPAGACLHCIACVHTHSRILHVSPAAIPCGKKEGGWRHDPTIQCGGQVPMGQPGYLLYPEAIRTTHREVVWGLQGELAPRAGAPVGGGSAVAAGT